MLGRGNAQGLDVVTTGGKQGSDPRQCAGFILQQTGTGPVQGFATTLIIGIIASLFTSIVVTRVLTTYLVHGRNAQTVSV